MELKTKRSRLIILPDGKKMFLSVLDADGNAIMNTPDVIQADIDSGEVSEVFEDHEVFIDESNPHSAVSKEVYGSLRKEEYKFLEEQLDLLWHDVNAGVFGDNAKNSNWYKGIKAIKEKYPKQ
jgi:protein required for attachment to host cells